MTSSTVVLRTVFACSIWSPVNGVYAVMRKWHRGVGISDARMLTRSLCMYPGYRRVVVLADMTVETCIY